MSAMFRLMIAAFMVCGCDGPNGADVDAKATPPAPMATVIGQWVSGCQDGIIASATFNGGGAGGSFDMHYHLEDECNTEAMVASTTFSWDSQPIGSDSTLDLTFSGYTLTPKHADAVSYLNGIMSGNFTDWQLGVSKDVLGATNMGTDILALESGDMWLGIYRITEQDVLAWAFNPDQPLTRPTDFSDSVLMSREQ